MKCPRCGLLGQLQEAPDGGLRRYRCSKQHRFTSLEVVTPPPGSVAYRALALAIRGIRDHFKEKACR
jgi:hypothetical protein